MLRLVRLMREGTEKSRMYPGKLMPFKTVAKNIPEYPTPKLKDLIRLAKKGGYKPGFYRLVNDNNAVVWVGKLKWLL